MEITLIDQDHGEMKLKLENHEVDKGCLFVTIYVIEENDHESHSVKVKVEDLKLAIKKLSAK